MPPVEIETSMNQIQVGDIELAYDDQGAGSPVVLLHGYPFNRSMWQDQIQALRDSYRVVVPDLRGHGNSDVAPATINEMARDVSGLMTALGINDGVIGGLSMGGYIALAFYRLFPERVRALVLADTRAAADTDESKQNRKKQAERALSEGMEGIANDLLPKVLSPASVASRPAVVHRVRQMMLTTKPEGAAFALQAMGERDDQSALLARIGVPTMIIVGRDDSITPVKDSESMQREIKGSQLEVIEGAGHVSNIEQPEQFNRALVDFLSLQGRNPRSEILKNG